MIKFFCPTRFQISTYQLSERLIELCTHHKEKLKKKRGKMGRLRDPARSPMEDAENKIRGRGGGGIEKGKKGNHVRMYGHTDVWMYGRIDVRMY